MKKLYFLLSLIIISFVSCESDSEDNVLDSGNEINNTESSFFPLKVGTFWKYKCEKSSSSSEDSEYEVTIQVISENSDGTFNIEIIYPDKTESEKLTCENSLVKCNTKTLLCTNRSTMSVDQLFYFFGGPYSLSGASWSGSGDVTLTITGDVFEMNFQGTEFKSSTINVEREHNFKEKFEKGVGLTSYYYSIAITTSTYSTFYHDYIYVYLYNIWSYTLIETNSNQ